MSAALSALNAQTPVQPAFAVCPPSMDIFSQRQVQVSARLIGDSSALRRVGAARPDSPNVVQLVVDTLGLPERGSFKAVRVQDSTLLRAAAIDVMRWRFTPAVASGCKVRERIVLALRGS